MPDTLADPVPWRLLVAPSSSAGQRIRLTAPGVLAGVGGRVRRLPLSPRRGVV
eukprot:COSAG04_NODE_1577_length_6261_cov_20.494645_6_plen_53_part_00